MLKYRIFFKGFNGTLHDAYNNDVIDMDFYANTPEEIAEFLKSKDMMGDLPKDYTFVVLPIYVAESK